MDFLDNFLDHIPMAALAAVSIAWIWGVCFVWNKYLK